MAESTTPRVSFEVVCPHCKKRFEAKLLSGSAERYRGFKCPHCRLFVPHQRVDSPPLAAATESL